MLNVQWDSRAQSDAARLDYQVRQRIIAAEDRYAETVQGDIRKLQGRQNQWRLRVGVWRVIVTLDYSVRTLTVLRIQRRSQAYR